MLSSIRKFLRGQPSTSLPPDRVFLSEEGLTAIEVHGVIPPQGLNHVYYSLGKHWLPSIEANDRFWNQMIEGLSLAEAIGGDVGKRAGLIRRTVAHAIQNARASD